MKSKTKENIAPAAEAAANDVATAETPASKETGGVVFVVRPSQRVSIVADDKVLYLGEGLKQITVSTVR